MKPKHRTHIQAILLSLACILMIWLIDALLDARYAQQTVWQILLSLHPHEYILRGLLVFLGIAIILEGTALWQARARARRALEESETKYRALFEATPAGVFLELLDSTVVECNERAAEMLGYTKTELCGMNAAGLVPAEVAQTFPALIEHELRNGLAMVEAQAKRKDGTVFPTEVGTRLIYLAGTPYVVVYVHDITARKETEMALAAEKEHLRVTLRSIGEGVITTDMDGRVLLMNPIAEEMTGWRQEEALGHPVDEIMHTVHPVSRDILPSGTLAVLSNETNPLERYECLLIGKDGQEHVILETTAPIRDDAGRIIGTVVAFRDITEQRRLEEERQRVLRLNSLARVASGIAHDFRTYLSTILTNASLTELCLDQPAEAREAIRRVRQAVKLAQSLAEQLLLFSSGQEAQRQPASIADVLTNAIELVTSGTPVTCRLSLPADLWRVHMDVTQMNQAITNLVLNAVQAMSNQGTIDILAANQFLPENGPVPLPAGPYVYITIRDYGPGIPPDALPHIFDPFFSTRPNGTGLGLPVAHSVVKRHGGYLTLESTPGQGATVHLYLPAVEEPPPNIPSPATAAPSTRQYHARVLVLDDDEALCLSLSLALNYLRYYVESVRSGEEALAHWERALAAGEPFHAAILDLNIAGAGMDGKTTAQRILQLDPHARLIVTSGFQDDPAFCRYQEWGFAAALAKPFDIADVVHTLQQVLTTRL